MSCIWLLLVAVTLLYFVFSVRIMLITDWYFNFCWVFTLSQQHLIFHYSVSEQADAQEERREHGQDITQTGQKDIPYHRISCPIYKLGSWPNDTFTTWGQAGHGKQGKWMASNSVFQHLFLLHVISFYFSPLDYCYCCCCNYHEFN